MISVKNLMFDYPGKRALQQINFEIEPDTITAVWGPNGAGKSTLFPYLAALETPTTGQIFVDGLDILEYPREAHTKMGYLPDFYGLYDNLTVSQCLLYHAMVQNINKRDRETTILNTAQRMQIEDQLDQEAGTLSRGQRQRLAIAQAIIYHPKVLLLDEPASGLDPEAPHHLSQLLVLLSQEGITVLVSSHILSELEGYCSHMLIIRNGSIVKHCSIEGLSKSMIDTYLETAKH